MVLALAGDSTMMRDLAMRFRLQWTIYELLYQRGEIYTAIGIFTSFRPFYALMHERPGSWRIAPLNSSESSRLMTCAAGKPGLMISSSICTGSAESAA